MQDAKIAENVAKKGLVSSCVDTLQRNISDVVVVRNVAGVAGNVGLHSSELRRYLLKENVPKNIVLCIKSLEFSAEVTSTCLAALANLCADIDIASSFVAEEGMSFITSVMAVHPTVGTEPDQMEAAFPLQQLVCQRVEGWVGVDAAVSDGLADAHQLLADDPTRADGEVADLGVAHLVVG